MKKLIFLAVTALVVTFCGSPGERVIEYPEFRVRNSPTIEIEKVVLNDTATIIYAGAYFRPNWWIRIVSDTYLLADGEKYVITGAEGIELDKEHFMPDSGEEKLVFFFPPLPKNTKSFDFIESDCDECFKIWGIDLTGKYRPKSLLPKELRQSAKVAGELKEPELRVAETKLKVYIHGLPDGYATGALEPYVINFLTSDYTQVKPTETSAGVYVYQFPQYGTSWAGLGFNDVDVQFLLAPGDDAEIHIDMEAHTAGRSRHTAFTLQDFAGFKGVYSDINTELNKPGVELEVGMYDLAMDHETWKLNDEQYLQKVKEDYEARAAQIASLDISENLRTVFTQSNKGIAMNAVICKEMFRATSKAYATEDFSVRASDPRPLTQADMDYIRSLELNDINWLLARDFVQLPGAMSESHTPLTVEQLNYITGTDHGLWHDLYKVGPVIRKVDFTTGADAGQLSVIESASDPFYLKAYQTMHRNAVATMERVMAEGGFTIADTPDVPAEKMLEAIVGQYKGKPVFVDFWATWCGPCINAMQTIKPLKPLMAEQGVVTIYITDVSSPKEKWLTMLPEIGGIHYYLGEDQMSTISEKYDINGIPHYLIFDKSGKKTFQTAGFPGVSKMNSELEKVW